MEKSFGLFFHLKKNKNKLSEELPVYMRITINGKVAEISTKRHCSPLNWNVTAGRQAGKSDAAKMFNSYLDTLQQKVFEAKRTLIEIDHEVSVDAIKDVILGKERTSKHMLMEIFQHHNDQLSELVGKGYADSTLTKYKSSLKHMHSFLKWKYSIEDIEINKINFEFITEYEFWLKSRRNCSHNTTMKYLGNLKKIIIRCIKNDWLKKDPFLGFSLAKKEVNRVALTDYELKTLMAKKLTIERLSLVRDIFIFSCYSGLAYGEVQKLKRSEIAIGIDGEKWIFAKRKKTDVLSRIPLLPIATMILKRYSEHPKSIAHGTALPTLSNQKMNAYLKEIGDICGITKKLTFHLARHTFATTIALGNGVPIETISKMLGHRSLKPTQHYAKILDRKISDDMNILRKKLLAEKNINDATS